MGASRWRLAMLTAGTVALTVTGASCGESRDRPGGAAAAARSAIPPAVTPKPPDRPSSPATTSGPSHQRDVVLAVAAQSQLPELPNGCEDTSLAMLLPAVGHPVDRLELARTQPVDPTPVAWRPGSGDQPGLDAVTSWGNPNVGFVGNVDGRPGYGIYHGPLRQLLDQQLPGRALDLTGQPFTADLAQVDRGVPVVVWTTTTYTPTDDWVTWQSPTGPVRATSYEHAVLLVGHTQTSLLINDPLTGKAAVPVDPGRFEAAWRQLGAQALTVRASF